MYSGSKGCIKLMMLKMKTKILRKLTIVRTLFAVGLLVLLLGIIDNAAILASAQDSKTIQISIVSDASRLTDTAYQPNPINIKVGDTIDWTNDDTSPHTVTEKNRSTSNNDDSDDKSNSGIVEKIVDEIITNIVVNIRNNMGGGEGDDHHHNHHNNSSQENSLSLAQFDSGIMQTGQTFRYTFNNPGTFEYYCNVHPSMVGEIVVS
jgi:plastocyanin